MIIVAQLLRRPIATWDLNSAGLCFLSLCCSGSLEFSNISVYLLSIKCTTVLPSASSLCASLSLCNEDNPTWYLHCFFPDLNQLGLSCGAPALPWGHEFSCYCASTASTVVLRLMSDNPGPQTDPLIRNPDGAQSHSPKRNDLPSIQVYAHLICLQ
ncbi:hypothetical protein DFH09DRAFT_1157273 [Mycena vulgaris]|nr:hypothetical protein DFH09DRAFT_1157273 [Mycena vulgaris]